MKVFLWLTWCKWQKWSIDFCLLLSSTDYLSEDVKSNQVVHNQSSILPIHSIPKGHIFWCLRVKLASSNLTQEQIDAHRTLQKKWDNTLLKVQHGAQSCMFGSKLWKQKDKHTLALVCTRQEESTDLPSAAPAGAALRVWETKAEA